MAHEQLIMAIGRVERALSRLEQVQIPPQSEGGEETMLRKQHDQLKQDARNAIREIDALLHQGAR